MQKLFRVVLWTVGGFAVICVLLRLTLLETWTVPDDPWLAASLEPTLGAGDVVLVLTRGGSEFGDLVRCPDPEDPGRFVVGRIVGVDGDNVSLSGRTLNVNGKPYNATEACEERSIHIKHPETGNDTELECSRVEIGAGWHLRAVLPKASKRDDVTKDVGKGRVFLLSDNRDIHDDSRDFGTLLHESCRQRIVFRLWGPGGWTDSDRRMTVVR
jgi:signal peptidase I